jgi:hypothetical protein
MNKLKLKLDDLTVESFDTAAAEREKGTVFGEECSCYSNCTCPGRATCDETECVETCGGCCTVCFETCGDITCGGATCELNNPTCCC